MSGKITFRKHKVDYELENSFYDYHLCLDGKRQMGYSIEQWADWFKIKIANTFVQNLPYNKGEEKEIVKICKQEIVKLYNLDKDFKESIHNTSEANKEP